MADRACSFLQIEQARVARGGLLGATRRSVSRLLGAPPCRGEASSQAGGGVTKAQEGTERSARASVFFYPTCRGARCPRPPSPRRPRGVRQRSACKRLHLPPMEHARNFVLNGIGIPFPDSNLLGCLLQPLCAFLLLMSYPRTFGVPCSRF